MNIDTEHLHHWMQAIRKSKNPQRTLDAFWKGQISSKEWLIEKLAPYCVSPVDIEIHGGWVGVLSSLLFQSALPVNRIISLDLDPDCEAIANEMNMLEKIESRFSAITGDMCNRKPTADVVINTSCEHLTQSKFDNWLKNIDDQLLVLQSNNYKIDEHIRIANSLDEFIEQSKIKVKWSGIKEFPLYNRWMIIGTKISSNI